MEEVMSASYLYFSRHVFMKLSSLLLRHAQRINTSFCLVITNQQSPDFGDFVERKFQCKATRPFSHPNIKGKKWSLYIRETLVIKGASHNVFLTEHA